MQRGFVFSFPAQRAYFEAQQQFNPDDPRWSTGIAVIDQIHAWTSADEALAGLDALRPLLQRFMAQSPVWYDLALQLNWWLVAQAAAPLFDWWPRGYRP